MKCEDLLKVVNDFVDGDIDPEVCDEFAAHLAGCNPCQIVVDNIRNTIALYREGKPYEMPAEFHALLQQRLHDCWLAKFGK